MWPRERRCRKGCAVHRAGGSADNRVALPFRVVAVGIVGERRDGAGRTAPPVVRHVHRRRAVAIAVVAHQAVVDRERAEGRSERLDERAGAGGEEESVVFKNYELGIMNHEFLIPNS